MSHQRVGGQGFRRLAAYIFGQDRPEGGEKIAMTSPVMQDRPGEVDQDEKIAMTAPVLEDSPSDDKWRTRFVMPAKYTLDTLPTAPDDITLTTVPGRRMAVIMFNGNAPSGDLIMAEEMLREWMNEQGLEAVGAAEHAFYDAPMVPGRYRRNEVMIPVAATE
ncbi:MAG: heme-binding protein [Pseudomonadota bacterium]